MAQKIQFLTLCLLGLQISLILCWDSKPNPSTFTSFKLQKTPLPPLQTQSVTISGGETIVIPLSYTRSGNLIVSAYQCEGDPTTFAVVTGPDIMAAEEPLLQWVTIGNSILTTSLKVEVESGSQGVVYLLVKLVQTSDDESHSYSEFRTSLATSSISPEKVFSLPSSLDIGWNWDATNRKLTGSWPVLGIDNTYYNDLLHETSKSDKLSAVYHMIATTSTKITEGMVKCHLKVKGDVGFVEDVQEISLPDTKNAVTFNFQPTEKTYFIAVVATVSKSFWNDNSRKSWEIQYLYPVYKYEVPAQYLPGAKEQSIPSKQHSEKDADKPSANTTAKTSSHETPTKPSEAQVIITNPHTPSNLTVNSIPIYTLNKTETQPTVNPNPQQASENKTENHAQTNSSENVGTAHNSTQELKTNTTGSESGTNTTSNSDEIAAVGNSTQETPVSNNMTTNQSDANATEKSGGRATSAKNATIDRLEEKASQNGKSHGLSSGSIFLIVVVVVVLLAGFAKMRQSRREQKQNMQQKDSSREYFENTSTYFELSAKKNKIDV